MTGKMNGKPRLVRCPRCLNVLPEPSDVPVYKCGGCGATLQAKKRNNSTVDTTSRKLDGDSSGKRKLEQDFGDQEAGSSSNQQLLLNSNDKTDQNSDDNDLQRSKKDQDADNKAPSHGNQKMKQLSDDHEASSSSNQQSLVNSMDEPEPHQNTHNDPRSSTELSGHEDPESSPEATGHNRIDQEQEQNQKLDQHPYQDAANKAKNGSIDAPSHGKQKVEQTTDDHEASKSSKYQSVVNPMDEHEPHQNIHNDPRSSTELSGHEDPESSPEPTGHNRTDQEQEHKQNQKPDQDHYQDTSKKQEITTDDATSTDDEKCRNLNQQLMVNSVNDLDENSDHNEPHNSSELSYHEDPESSPESTVHNKIDHANQDDHDQVFLSCRREFEESNSEFEEAIANTRTARVSNSSSKSSFKTLIAEKLLDTKQKKPVYLDEDDTKSEDETADLHHHRRNDRMETARDRFGGVNYYGSGGSVSSFDGIDYQNPRKHRIGSILDASTDSGNGYRFNRRNQVHHLHRSTDVRSFYGLNEFDRNPRHRSHMIAENPKLERIELLKMVQKLQNQLERTNISKPPQVPLYGGRMAFSGETTAVNGSSCHHCCPQGQNRHFSAQLPRQHVCCNGPHFEPNAYYSPRFSALSSPIHSHHPESEFSATDDYRHRNNDVIKQFHSPKKKRYVRPIASGSPWITCYRCSTLLELPQSFLVFNKRYHSLRCGACMKVLNFTLSNGTHVSRYYPEETIAAPPCSEVEDYDELNRSRAGPVSCSDRSFQKSYSTETDRNGSWEFSEERRKAAMSRDPSGSTQPSSSKASGRPRLNGSPLHRLMGYSSPSKVIRG